MVNTVCRQFNIVNYSFDINLANIVEDGSDIAPCLVVWKSGYHQSIAFLVE
jgi:hypothetical protein